MAGLIIRLLILALLVWLAILIVRRIRAHLHRRDRPSDVNSPAAPAMVACAHCGVHVPAREAVYRGGQPYCCDAHGDAGPRG